MIRTVFTVLFIIVCLALIVVVLMQEGKSAGLGTIGGMADTYWEKNKARSVEGKLGKATKIAVAAFFVLALVLNLKWFA